jgi:hypothetical protein
VKINKLSTFIWIAFEDSNEINQLATNDFNTKKYNNFFQSAFFTYEISDKAALL